MLKSARGEIKLHGVKRFKIAGRSRLKLSLNISSHACVVRSAAVEQLHPELHDFYRVLKKQGAISLRPFV